MTREQALATLARCHAELTNDPGGRFSIAELLDALAVVLGLDAETTELLDELREAAEIWEARCRRYETHMAERVPMQYWPEYADAVASGHGPPEGERLFDALCDDEGSR